MGETEHVEFFVSYTSADLRWAEWIAWVLEEAGYTTRIQVWDFAPGSNFVLEMDEAARVSRRTLAVLSPAFLEADYPQSEWAAAVREDPKGWARKLLPVRVRACDPDGLLGSIVYVDLVGLSEDAARERLLGAAGAARAKPAQSPSFPEDQPVEGERAAFPSEGPPIWNVPPVTGRFVGREALLEQLASRLASGDAAALTQAQALHGLGGVGKTRVAVEFAHRNRDDYDVVWWMRSEDPVTRLGNYAELADKLALPERDERDQKARAAGVKGWLERHGRWLLVFDNAPGPDGLHELLPRGGGGHVLITSRRQGGWRALADVCPVDVWDRSESVAFLQQRSGHRDPVAAAAIAEALGDLPLALEQAGAYVDSAQVSLAGYQRRLNSHAPLLFSRHQPADYEHTVATTWKLAVEELERDRGCAPLLFCCAFLAPEQIPRELFTHDAIADGFFAAPNGDVALDDAVARLLAFSLVTADENSLSMHRLVQDVIRSRLRDQRWLELTQRLVFDAFPTEGHDHRTWPTCERLLPHALAVTEHARQADVETLETAALLVHAAGYLYARVELSTAEALYRRALAVFEAAYGPDHPAVAGPLGRLGLVLRELGELEEAREHLQRGLEIKEAAYGPDHPVVAGTLCNLGSVLQRLGDLKETRERLQRALKIFETACGPDHPEVAATLANLGDVLEELGELDEARERLQRALKIFETAYGPDHPRAALALGTLGIVLRGLGELEEAREFLQRALKIEHAAYGPDHPRVASMLGNLGIVLRELGELEEARQRLQRALKIFEAAYGPQHPKVATMLDNLGIVLGQLGELEEARERLQHALKINEAYGPDRPDVARTLGNLGVLLEQLGELEDARECQQRALEIFETAYGPDYPDVALTLGNLGNVLERLGNTDEARRCRDRAQRITDRNDNRP